MSVAEKADAGLARRGTASDWTRGLKTRTANALRAHGFTSREQVEATPLRRLRRINNLGEHSLDDLLRWLSLRPRRASTGPMQRPPFS